MNTSHRRWPFDTRFLIGTDGSIIGPSSRVLKLFIDPRGYPRFTRYVGAGHWTQHFVHVAVCKTFHGPRPPGHEVAHGNGIQLDCSAANLSWKTPRENEADKIAHGTRMQGEGHHQHKLTEADVRAIRTSSETNTALGKQYGVARVTIAYARAGKTWRHI